MATDRKAAYGLAAEAAREEIAEIEEAKEKLMVKVRALDEQIKGRQSDRNGAERERQADVLQGDPLRHSPGGAPAL